MAIVKKYLAEVVHSENKVENIYTVEVKSHSGSFKYQPGQFLHLALDEYDPSSGWPESRCFSMQSSPTDEHIRITYAIKGAFTTRMSKELNHGSRVTLKMPYGDLFTQQHAKVNTVFIAGGTGITPFLSLFTHESFNEYTKPKIYLGFRSKAYNIYNNELSSSCNSSKVVQLFNEEDDGIIDIQQIFSENGTSCYYFISGPPVMINSFRQTLIDKSVPTKNILTDDWE